ncbi:hypothetical protein MHU86_21839 [Fragilaria crotonensis]|nr:hypothetical protein MHU86_21839 [Fragilaria crotonensis]
MSKFSGTSKLHKELQVVAAFAAYEKCCKGDAMTATAIESSMERQYFGDPTDLDSIGLGEQLVRGLGMFAGLYKEEERSGTVRHSAGIGGGGGDDNLLRSPPPTKRTMLVMKPALHCLGEHKRIVVGGTTGISLSMMLAKGVTDKESKNVRGRSLHRRTKEAIKNCQMALDIVLRHDSPYKSCALTGILPPGMCFENYLLFVRQKMFIELMMPHRSSELVEVEQTTDEITTTTATPMTTTTDSSDAVPLIATSIMPENWMFPGFIVFSLFGPIVESGMRHYQSHLLVIKPNDGTLSGKRLLTSDNINDNNNTSNKKQKCHTEQVDVEPGGGPLNHSSSPGNKKLTVSQGVQTAATEQSELLQESADENGTGGGNRLLSTDNNNNSNNKKKCHTEQVQMECDDGPLKHSYSPGDKKLTMSQEFQIAATEQSKLLQESHEENLYNDRLVSMHTTKVEGLKVRIENVKFLFLHSGTDDPARVGYLQKLKVLNEELEEALQELNECEIAIVESLKRKRNRESDIKENVHDNNTGNEGQNLYI